LWLERWIEKLRLVMWLHPEVSLERRALLFGATALAAATVLHLPPQPEAGLAAEFADVVRRAFMPRLYVQLWRHAPVLDLLENA
jgi:hypothetical protein